MRIDLRIVILCILSMSPFVAFSLRAEEVATPLSLSESIAIALERSTLVKASAYAVKGADYERKAAGTDFLPKINTAYSFTRFNEDPHMKSPAGEYSSYPVDMKIGDKERYQWNTYLTQPLFTGGALVSAYQIAKLGKDIAQENLSKARQEIILNVKEAYFTILKIQKIRTVALQAVEQVNSHVEVAQAFYDQEMIPRNDLLEAQVRFAQVKQVLIRADNGVEIAKAYFNTVLRREVSQPVEVEDILEYQPEVFSLDECANEAFQKRPEMREAEFTLEKAQKGVKLAKSRFFPTLSLVTDYQRMGEHADVSGNPYEDAEQWMVTTLFSWDVWEWGKRHYQVSASRAKVAQAEELKKQVGDVIALEVKESYLNLKEAEKNIMVAKTAIDQAEENFKLNKEKYNEQMATTTDVLDAQTLLTQAQSNYYNALSDYHIAKAKLGRAMGRE